MPINAVQSSTYTSYLPSYAIDGDIGGSSSCTKYSGEKWLRVEFPKVLHVTNVHLYLRESNFNDDYFGTMKIETRIGYGDEWKLCADDHTVTKPLNPDVITCANTNEAKQVRITMTGGKYLCVGEVKVIGRKGEVSCTSFIYFCIYAKIYNRPNK